MELTTLLDKLKMDHLEAQLDAVCEQAAARQEDYRTFLVQAVSTGAPLLHTSKVIVSRPYCRAILDCQGSMILGEC